MATTPSGAHIIALLEKAATTDAEIVLYNDERISDPLHLSYKQLHILAKQRADLLRNSESVIHGKIILIHFQTHLENITWFWAAVLAGCVPCMSTPPVNNSEGRRLHFKHLHSLLQDPIILTNPQLKNRELSEISQFRILVTDGVETDTKLQFVSPGPQRSSVSIKGDVEDADLAILMLTSGSTGNAKAVCLTHKQVYASIEGKLAVMPVPQDSALLNWVGLDHVASLVEIHLCAMFAGLVQVHAPAAMVVADPLLFLVLLSKHGVSRTFAAHFFLHKLERALEAAPAEKLNDINLHRLLFIASGGEPNTVDVCARVTDALMNLGATTPNIIAPGFGMTEICAGAIYNLKCPTVDLESGNTFASLGTCMPGIEMRISSTPQTNTNAQLTMGAPAVEGELKIRGDVVFKGYFNNDQATRDAFTSDGWFKTGDLASIDASGSMKYAGRLKDVININGVKYLPQEIEDAINQTAIPGIAASMVVCFQHRFSPESPTAGIMVVYQQTYEMEDIAARMETLQSIIQIVTLFTGVRPRVLPLAPGRLSQSTIGKLSRSKTKAALLQGQYKEEEDFDRQINEAYRTLHFEDAQTETERMLMRVILETLDMTGTLSVDTPFLDTGVTSVDLIRLKRATETVFGIDDVPMITIMAHITIRSLARALEEIREASPLNKVGVYNPVITLQPNGIKTPLWLIHPGIGEVFIFLGLAQYFPDRPVHAMRARGFNPGEKPFEDLQDVLSTYHRALKKQQSQGPYAIAGYSYGSVLAFELAKVLEAGGETVKFVGAFNLPPHIKERMRQLDWTAGALYIAQFCAIISEDKADELRVNIDGLQQEEQITRILAVSDVERCKDLAITPKSLYTWANVAFALQKIGWEYEPSSTVAHMDVFFCQPLRDVARSREEYRNTKLNLWVNFVRDGVRYHEVDGEHYTMLSTEHIHTFQKTLKKAMHARGL